MVFSSFEPEDLRADQTSSVGVKHLRAYLELAKYGVPQRARTEMAIDRHAEQVATALRAAGCTVRPRWGCRSSGSTWRSPRPAGASPAGRVAGRTGLGRAGDHRGPRGAPVNVLATMMGWPAVARVWLPSWLSDPEGVTRELVERARASAEVPRQVGEVTASTTWQT